MQSFLPALPSRTRRHLKHHRRPSRKGILRASQSSEFCQGLTAVLLEGKWRGRNSIGTEDLLQTLLFRQWLDGESVASWPLRNLKKDTPLVASPRLAARPLPSTFIWPCALKPKKLSAQPKWLQVPTALSSNLPSAIYSTYLCTAVPVSPATWASNQHHQTYKTLRVLNLKNVYNLYIYNIEII